ncbi:MAG: YIP1 family protein [Eubacteriales bacterium]|nr:YIP1 family protein [Eubacteriales bacterium]MDD4475430.1 YIP1 family protein [Eubacteriales bacterium]
MKKKLSSILLLSLCLIFILSAIPVSAKVPYQTYSYEQMGPVESPDAYVPERVLSAKSLMDSLENPGNEDSLYRYGDLKETFAFSQLADVFVDAQQWLYISDKVANRVMICDENYNLKYIVSTFINDQGIADSLEAPEGLFVTDTEIFVADSANSRIVIFDKVGNFKEIVPEPASEVMPEGNIYTPIAVAADKAGRIYVVSRTTNYGVISLNRDGSFNGFLGAQKTTPNLWQYFWRIFQTPEQIAATIKNVPTEYNNIAIDDGGFIYVTSSSIDPGSQAAANFSKDGRYSPVKKLNPNGTDVMRRTGFYGPSGEIRTMDLGVSKIKDVALGPNGMWSIIDDVRSRIYTYDQDGNNLFNFGDIGKLVGNIQKIAAVEYQGTNILAVDATENSIVIYKRTNYGALLDEALRNTLENKYQNAVNYFINILQMNNNYTQAYVGIGKSKMMSGEYTQAMSYFKYGYDRASYSEAYGEARKEWIEKYVYVIPVILIVVLFLISRFFKFANKVNKKGQVMKEKRTLLEEFLYAFHVIFHPFDGFWDLKHEKRGSFKGAILILGITILAFIYNTIGTGYLFGAHTANINYFMQINFVLMPVLLWTSANWGLTTLFDGEGSYKDVFVTTCYSLTPLPMLMIPSAMLKNVVTIEEAGLLDMVMTIAIVWMVMLLFFGTMVIHDYSLFKNMVTWAVTILGVAFIVFVVALFGLLVTQIVKLFVGIYVELSLRV